jgi:hypothetical protein
MGREYVLGPTELVGGQVFKKGEKLKSGIDLIDAWNIGNPAAISWYSTRWLVEKALGRPILRKTYGQEITAPIGNVLSKAGETIIGGGEQAVRKAGLESKADTFVEKLSGGVGSGVISLAQAIGITAATKDPSLAASVFGARTEATMFREAKKAGVDQATAELVARGAGMTEAVLERLGLEFMFKNFGGRILNAATKSLTEGVQEWSQEVGSNVWRKSFKKDQKVFEGGLIAFLVGLMTGGPASIALDSNVDTTPLDEAVEESGIDPKSPEGESIVNKMVEKAPQMLEEIAEVAVPAVEQIPVVPVAEEVAEPTPEAPVVEQVEAAEKAALGFREKLAAAITKAKPARASAEATMTQRRRERAARMRAIHEEFAGTEAMERAIAPMRGELLGPGDAIFEPIGEQFTAQERDLMADTIRTHPNLEGKEYTKQRLFMTMRSILDEGYLPTRGDIQLIEDTFGPEVSKALMGKRPKGQQLKEFAAELVTAPKAFLASFDLSGSLRQGLVLALTHPKTAVKSFAAQLKAFGDRQAAEQMDQQVRNRELADVGEDAGLDLTRWMGEAHDLTEREERFMSHIFRTMAEAELKGVKKALWPLKLHAMGIEASERAYATYLNKLRADTFDSVAREMMEADITPDNNPDAYRDLALLLNNATGRAPVKLFKGPFWNFLTWSPRFIKSRFTYHANALRLAAKGPTPIRREALKQLLATTFTWLGLAGLIKGAAEAFDWDIDMSLDPRDTNFLKARIGKQTTVDLSGGFGPVFRLIARLASKQLKYGGKVRQAKRSRELYKFGRYKLAPVPQVVWSGFVEGKMPMGEPVTASEIVKSLTVPITLQEAEDLIRVHGMRGTAFLIPDILGAGVNVYDDTAPDMSELVKQYADVYGRE